MLKEYLKNHKKNITKVNIISAIIIIVITPFNYSLSIDGFLYIYRLGFPYEYLSYYILEPSETTLFSFNAFRLSGHNVKEVAFDGIPLVLNIILLSVVIIIVAKIIMVLAKIIMRNKTGI